MYKAGEGGIWRTIFAKYEIKLVYDNVPTRGPWFVKFVRGQIEGWV